MKGFTIVLPKSQRKIGAVVLQAKQFRKQVLRDRTKYARKSRNSSSRKYEDSIQLAMVVG